MNLSFFKKIDWWIVVSLIPLMALSLTTMSSFMDAGGPLVYRQLLWIGISFIAFLIISSIDVSFLKQSKVLLFIYVIGLSLLIGLIFVGSTNKGATSWFNFGGFSFQPSDFVKLTLILVLAKYLARRHIEIRAMKHIFITGMYFVIPFLLIFLQPDFGSAIILFAIWFGMILVSGISRKHLLILFTAGLALFMVMWTFVFQEYQKDRLRTFVDPLSDIQGTGYNAYQSTIAVGSGQLLGKGVGYGTQSRLNFLPEYETDFIYAAISEEWGFIGSIIILSLFGIVIIRILVIGYQMNSNFELLYAVGVALYFMSHVLINIGMNIGLMPVTGVTLPFMSYGGSHLLVEWMALGILMAMRRQSRAVYKDDSPDVFLK
ncbi:MAG: rod shape-determining protein RodA [Candidatus Pacebacteria bacterium]|nr:rod shape-determining protein RodA [Candidatus Paceibacterota bacterium]